MAHTQHSFMGGTWDATPEFCRDAEIDYMVLHIDDPESRTMTCVLSIADVYTGTIKIERGPIIGNCALFSFTCEIWTDGFDDTTWANQLKFNYDVSTGHLTITGVGDDKTCYAEFHK